MASDDNAQRRKDDADYLRVKWVKLDDEPEPRFVPTVIDQKTDATLIYAIKRWMKRSKTRRS
jgi:hypothetical protein